MDGSKNIITHTLSNLRIVLYWRERLCGSKMVWGEQSEGVVSSFAMGSRGVQPAEVTPMGQDRDWGGLL